MAITVTVIVVAAIAVIVTVVAAIAVTVIVAAVAAVAVGAAAVALFIGVLLGLVAVVVNGCDAMWLRLWRDGVRVQLAIARQGRV